jgi:hypothetical protein
MSSKIIISNYLTSDPLSLHPEGLDGASADPVLADLHNGAGGGGDTGD